MLVGASLFIAFSAVLGGRLLALAARTRAAPELIMGLAFVLTGCLGTAFDLLSYQKWIESEVLLRACRSASRLSIHLGVAAQALFTWRVFRPDARWAGALFVAIAGGLSLVAAGHAAVGGLGDAGYRGGWFWARAALHPAALAWGAVESLLYWTRMRRRLRLGLADPVLTNRFLVWGVAIAAGAAALCIGPLARLATGGSGAKPVVLALAAPLGLVSALGYWLTFFPPERYRRLLLQRAGRGTASQGGAS